MDAEMIQRTLQMFETALGTPEVIIVGSFAMALEIIRGINPSDIVILDTKLEDSTMQETISNVRLIEDYVPTFILTGHSKADVDALLWAANCAHVQVVEKGPTTFERGFLTGVVATVISTWHARRKTPMREALQILEGYRRTEA